MSEDIKPAEQSVDKIPEQEKIWDSAVDLGDLDNETRKIIESCVRNPENFLGEGGAGKVYVFEKHCIKMMRNIKKLRGNPPEVEFRIQWRARHLNVAGVYAPRAIRLAEGESDAAIIMERLMAVNMLMVIQGKETLPKKFDLDYFFQCLENYLDGLHELGIIHNDIDARNIMIDIETGLPRVIDFGNALDFSKNMPDDFNRRADIDLAAMEKSRELIKKYILFRSQVKTNS